MNKTFIFAFGITLVLLSAAIAFMSVGTAAENITMSMLFVSIPIGGAFACTASLYKS